MSINDKSEERAFLIECIKVYKSLPALWDSRSPEYRDREHKDIAYRILVDKFKERYPNTNRNEVKKKINILRSNFRKEVRHLARIGQEESDRWYFEDMKFLRDTVDIKDLQEIRQQRLKEEEQLEEESMQFSFEDHEDQFNEEIIKECSSPEPDPPSVMVDGTDPIVITSSTSNARTSSLFGEYELKLAEFWAMEFRKMAPEQQIFAKKAINDIIYEVDGREISKRKSNRSKKENKYVY